MITESDTDSGSTFRVSRQPNFGVRARLFLAGFGSSDPTQLPDWQSRVDKNFGEFISDETSRILLHAAECGFAASSEEQDEAPLGSYAKVWTHQAALRLRLDWWRHQLGEAMMAMSDAQTAGRAIDRGQCQALVDLIDTEIARAGADIRRFAAPPAVDAD